MPGGPGPSRQRRSESHRALLSEKRKGTVTRAPSHRLLHRALGRWRRASGRQTGRVDGQCEAGPWQPARSLGFRVPTLGGPRSPGMRWRVQGRHWPQTQGTPAGGVGTSSRVALVGAAGPRGCHPTQALPLQPQLPLPNLSPHCPWQNTPRCPGRRHPVPTVPACEAAIAVASQPPPRDGQVGRAGAHLSLPAWARLGAWCAAMRRPRWPCAGGSRVTCAG